jgi:hypothetical protein
MRAMNAWSSGPPLRELVLLNVGDAPPPEWIVS